MCAPVSFTHFHDKKVVYSLNKKTEAISVFFMQQTSKLLNLVLDTTHAQGVTDAANRAMGSSDHLTPSADLLHISLTPGTIGFT